MHERFEELDPAGAAILLDRDGTVQRLVYNRSGVLAALGPAPGVAGLALLERLVYRRLEVAELVVIRYDGVLPISVWVCGFVLAVVGLLGRSDRCPAQRNSRNVRPLASCTGSPPKVARKRSGVTST